MKQDNEEPARLSLREAIDLLSRESGATLYLQCHCGATVPTQTEEPKIACGECGQEFGHPAQGIEGLDSGIAFCGLDAHQGGELVATLQPSGAAERHSDNFAACAHLIEWEDIPPSDDHRGPALP